MHTKLLGIHFWYYLALTNRKILYILFLALNIIYSSGCKGENDIYFLCNMRDFTWIPLHVLISLRADDNLTLISTVCEAAQRSLFRAPNGLNELPEVRFKFPLNLIGDHDKQNKAFFNWPIVARTQIWVHSWKSRTRISALFRRRS